MKLLPLIDGDIVVYRAAFAAQYTAYSIITEEGETILHNKADYLDYIKDLNEDSYEVEKITVVLPEKQIYINIDNVLSHIMKQEFFTKEYRLYLTSTDRSNFRYTLAKTKPYKGNRETMVKPFYYSIARQYLIDKYSAEVIYNEEADDRIARVHNNGTCIVSIDKDFNQLAGYHYDFVKNTLTSVTELQARKFFYTQLLTGDVADNIEGIRGIGPIRALRLLDTCITEEDFFEKVYYTYLKAFDSVELANARLLENGNLLYLRRHENDSFSFPRSYRSRLSDPSDRTT